MVIIVIIIIIVNIVSIYTIILLTDSVCSPHICVAYLWSLQTEFWADRFTTCLKLSPLTYLLYCWHFSSAAFVEKKQQTTQNNWGDCSRAELRKQLSTVMISEGSVC